MKAGICCWTRPKRSWRRRSTNNTQPRSRVIPGIKRPRTARSANSCRKPQSRLTAQLSVGKWCYFLNPAYLYKSACGWIVNAIQGQELLPCSCCRLATYPSFLPIKQADGDFALDLELELVSHKPAERVVGRSHLDLSRVALFFQDQGRPGQARPDQTKSQADPCLSAHDVSIVCWLEGACRVEEWVFTS